MTERNVKLFEASLQSASTSARLPEKTQEASRRITTHCIQYRTCFKNQTVLNVKENTVCDQSPCRGIQQL